MGRKQGGARTGTPGTAYSNRTDLNANRTPLTAFRGQPYGTGVQQAAVEGSARTAPPPAAPAGAPSASPGGGPLFGGQHPVPPGVPAPGEFPPLLAPTERPNEPVTAGMPFGAGPNVVPQPFRPDPMAQARAQLAALPAVHQTPMTRALTAAATASTANATNPNIAQGAA
jgi:hypothetical protein